MQFDPILELVLAVEPEPDKERLFDDLVGEGKGKVDFEKTTGEKKGLVLRVTLGSE